MPVMGGLTSKLDQVAQGCVQRFQISPRSKILPTSLSGPFPAFGHPHCEEFSSLYPSKVLRISLSASHVHCL